MRAFFEKFNKDHAGGALMILLGFGAMLQGASYHVGSLRAMGPGFFPLALGAILALTGLVTMVTGGRNAAAVADKALPMEWRGWACIALGIVSFVVLGRYGGLLPASFAIVFISALGDRENTVKSALVLAAAIVVICVVVFSWALQMQFPLFQWG